ncbi:chalcone isomerase family protein [Ferrimonas senticii]|uniref:chalcone isomerase family protein n=1 Tax=Ferrimonas senticii TaxID=394566 RepID=UPI000480D689|nr:chalcone isomerase family protein [Ferrimonas senticii]
MKRVVIAACMALLSGNLTAATVAGVSLPELTTVASTEIPYQGAGVRKKFFMKLYVASLYGSDQVTAMLSGHAPAMIQLDIISGLITADKMTASMEEGFAQSAGDRLTALRPQIDQFTAAFSAPVVEGDRFQVISLPGQAVELHKNGSKLVAVDGEEFRQVLLGIWLGDKPLSDDLKQQMLGG